MFYLRNKIWCIFVILVISENAHNGHAGIEGVSNLIVIIVIWLLFVTYLLYEANISVSLIGTPLCICYMLICDFSLNTNYKFHLFDNIDCLAFPFHSIFFTGHLGHNFMCSWDWYIYILFRIVTKTIHIIHTLSHMHSMYDLSTNK